LLNEDESPDPRLLAKSFRAIDTQSEKLGRLTHQLLDVSRIEAGKLQLQPCSVDLSHLVRETAMAVQAGTSNHVIQLDMSEKCVASVDPLRIEQVVTNLLSNAVKYSPNGGPIAVKLERSAQSKVTFEVRDWGVGIPMERRSQLFSRFFQAHGEGHFGGLGLGLYISRQIVDLHGGTIAVDFPLDGGTRFTVELPERVSAEQASTWPRAPRNGQTGDRTPPQGHPPVVAVHSTERVDADRQSKGVLRVAATT
jgi:signal transduction histidine kinase